MQDQRRAAELRSDVGCPLPLAYVYLGERFGHWPWEIEREPADRVAYYLNIIGIEGEAEAAYRDDPETVMFWDDEEE